MSHYWKKEIKNLRERNMDKDSPTPALKRRKNDRPFIVQRRYTGNKDYPERTDKLFCLLYPRKWINVGKYSTCKGAEQSMKAESRKSWLGKNWEFRIVDLTAKE